MVFIVMIWLQIAKLKQETAFSIYISFYCNKSGPKYCTSKQFCLMLFNTLYFASLPVGLIEPKFDLPEAISACLGQALISNPDISLFLFFISVITRK